MAVFQKSFVLFMASLCFCFSSFPTASTQNQGTATFFSPPYVPSACYGNEDKGQSIASASTEIWNNGNVCGQIYHFTCVSVPSTQLGSGCLGTSWPVMVVDHCLGCNTTFGLSQEVFRYLADTNAGEITISYT
ncbi:EG45-like domain containing protein [Tripterygium wilfordii]|uniref:EG45-like domain containing protein n=1 Tax=Tripterygium wilfordii TaxID=458696 RepID=UPI0018F83ED7|nr:EG45-like domain containing protein [Tripterygium wilfordii]